MLLPILQQSAGTRLNVRDISTATGISPYDIISTLQHLGLIKYWRGKHLLALPRQQPDGTSRDAGPLTLTSRAVSKDNVHKIGA